MPSRVAGMPPANKGRLKQLLRRGNGCNDGSIPREPAGPAYSRPHCLSLHIRPLGICSRFADRGLSVFVIEGPARAVEFFGPLADSKQATNASAVYPNGVIRKTAPMANRQVLQSLRCACCVPAQQAPDPTAPASPKLGPYFWRPVEQ
jgi:hypothetical protein